MKKNIPIFGTALIILCLAVAAGSQFSARGQASPQNPAEEDIVILKVMECSGMMPSSMFVVYNNGATERTEIEKINTKNLEANLKSIHGKIKEITGKGYILTNATGGNSDGAICTTFIFKKRT